jgi:hypothetical protein
MTIRSLIKDTMNLEKVLRGITLIGDPSLLQSKEKD